MKKKIKRIFGFIGCLAILLASVFVASPRTNADSSYIDYSGYNYVVWINLYNGGAFEGYILADVDYDSITYNDENPYTEPYFIDLDPSQFNEGIYLVQADIAPYDSAYFYGELVLSESVLWQSYINQATLANYNDGVAYGMQQENQVIYQKGFVDGEDSVKPGSVKYQEIFEKGQEYEDQYYEPGQPGYQSVYNRGYQAALDTIGDEENPSWLVMFKTIINYFVSFFTVGLNVEVFGINIGNFCIAIFMLSAMLFIVRFIFGR